MMCKSNPLLLHVLDVGHGESLIIQFHGSFHYAIVDCNFHRLTNRDPGDTLSFDQDASKALNFFRKVKESGSKPVVEFACLSHPHLDHMLEFGNLLKGLADLEIPVYEFWSTALREKRDCLSEQRRRDFPGITTGKGRKEEALDDLCSTLELLEKDHGLNWRTIEGRSLPFWQGHSVEVDILAPCAEHVSNYLSYLRDHGSGQRSTLLSGSSFLGNDDIISSCLLLKYGEAQIVLGGDLTEDAWLIITSGTLTEKPIDLNCHALKVSHHGSRRNYLVGGLALWPFITGENGKLQAAISGGYRLDLPHDDVLQSLEMEAEGVYRTGIYAPRPRAAPSGSSTNLPWHQLATIRAPRFVPGTSYHGDITMRCFDNGACEVTTEFNP